MFTLLGTSSRRNRKAGSFRPWFSQNGTWRTVVLRISSHFGHYRETHPRVRRADVTKNQKYPVENSEENLVSTLGVLVRGDRSLGNAECQASAFFEMNH